MMELLLIYLWLRLDTLIAVMGIVVSLAGIVSVVFTIANYIDGGVLQPWSFWPMRVALLTLIVGGPLLIALPSSRDVAVLVAAHYGKEAIVSAEGQKLLELARKRANEWLDEQLRQPTR